MDIFFYTMNIQMDNIPTHACLMGGYITLLCCESYWSGINIRLINTEAHTRSYQTLTRWACTQDPTRCSQDPWKHTQNLTRHSPDACTQSNPHMSLTANFGAMWAQGYKTVVRQREGRGRLQQCEGEGDVARRAWASEVFIHGMLEPGMFQDGPGRHSIARFICQQRCDHRLWNMVIASSYFRK